MNRREWFRQALAGIACLLTSAVAPATTRPLVVKSVRRFERDGLIVLELELA